MMMNIFAPMPVQYHLSPRHIIAVFELCRKLNATAYLPNRANVVNWFFALSKCTISVCISHLSQVKTDAFIRRINEKEKIKSLSMIYSYHFVPISFPFSLFHLFSFGMLLMVYFSAHSKILSDMCVL